MNHFLKWLGNKFFRQKPVPKTTVQQTVGRANGDPRARRAQAQPKKPIPGPVGYVGERNAVIEDGGPGKNVFVRNKYIREDSGTHETLKIVDDSLVEEQDEDGLDPYNTGRFDRSKTWKLRS